MGSIIAVCSGIVAVVSLLRLLREFIRANHNTNEIKLCVRGHEHTIDINDIKSEEISRILQDLKDTDRVENNSGGHCA